MTATVESCDHCCVWHVWHVWQESRDHYSFGFYRASRAQIERMVRQVQARESNYYGETDQYLSRALAYGAPETKKTKN